jgi:carbamoyltransferase
MAVYWGVNLSHDGSICQLKENGEIDWFVEEERYSRVKQLELPFSPIPFIDYSKELYSLQISGLYERWDQRTLEETAKHFSTLTQKFYNIQNCDDRKKVTYELFLEHHVYHAACGFYNSGFKESAVLVVDGMGNYINDDYHEVETIYTFKYPNKVKCHHVNVTNSFMNCDRHPLDRQPIGIGMIYSAIADYLGFGTLGSGKLMGMSAYGEEDPNIKSFIIDGKLDSTQFYRTKYGVNFIPYDYVIFDQKELTPDNPKIQNLYNLAYRMQKDFEYYMINLILYTLDITKSKNLVLTGGCALNCVANYKYLDILPNDVKLYVEPISTDAGTSIGLSKLLYHQKTQSTHPKPLKTLYLGLEQ